MIEKEKPPRDLWDIKLIPGGLIDLEFIAQVAVLERTGETASSGHRAPPKPWRGFRPASPTARPSTTSPTPMRSICR